MNTIDQIKELLDSIPKDVKPVSIGVGITTHNRYEIFQKSYSQWMNFLPLGAKLVVVDDASETPVPESDYRFETNVGIARAKNKCLELLEGCDHIFLSDDDTYPLVEGWWKPYVDSKEVHLNYIFEDFANPHTRRLNDTLLLWKGNGIRAYSHVRGCLLYVHRSVLERVGGMDPIFGKWGYEHPNWSDRIYNAGMTSFRYMDVENSKGLFYSADEQEEVTSTCIGTERTQQIQANSKIYDARKQSSAYIEFREKKNVILTSYFTSVSDPMRSNQVWEADKGKLRALLDSCADENVVVLNDCFANDSVFQRVPVYINPYFQRWVSYYQYLRENKSVIDYVFCVDASDVELLRSPWNYMEKGFLYTGDEPQILGCEWMLKHHPHAKIQEFMIDHKDLPLLNAGILGGDIETILKFIGKLLSFYFQAVNDKHFHSNRPDCGLGDMGVFNYIARTEFSDVLRHGDMVNTEFKKDERNGFSWFKHK